MKASKKASGNKKASAQMEDSGYGYLAFAARRGITLGVEGLVEPEAADSFALKVPTQQVKDEWDKLMARIHFLFDGAYSELGNFEMDEITLNLEFDTKVNMWIFASGDLKGAITVTIKRKISRASS